MFARRARVVNSVLSKPLYHPKYYNCKTYITSNTVSFLRPSSIPSLVLAERFFSQKSSTTFKEGENYLGNSVSRVYIGSTFKDVSNPKNIPLVPISYAHEPLTQTELGHLQWMLKKDLLGQDIFLIGPPGQAKRHLAMMYAEITKREIEYLSLSRDTTESDMKQRREVFNKTAQYFDQAAVRAATEGRLLIIEGIEKAERNVLPLLNNLLENREMNLDDGRHLIAAERYDKLLKEHGIDVLNKWKLVRVNENFRVIALGLPVPFFKGNPLDPPLRSRFQARSIAPLTTEEMLNRLHKLAPKTSINKLSTINNFAYSVVWSNDPDFRNTEDNPWAITMPHFPLENLIDAAKLINKYPNLPLYRLLSRIYPYELVVSKEDESEIEAVRKVMEKSGITIHELSKIKTNLPPPAADDLYKYVPVHTHEATVQEMLESYAINRDICLIGDRGSGKSTVVSRFAELTGYKIEPIVLYKDMTSRDLLQQRTTKPNGDTIWNNSPLVDAALEGKLAVLDGLDQLHSSTLAVIFRLVHDRELQLYDGKRLLRSDRYDNLKTAYGFSDKELNEQHKIFRIHPKFYIIAISSSTPKTSSSKSKKQWLTPEILSLFAYHQLPGMNLKEEMEVIKASCGDKWLTPEMEKIIRTARDLRESKDSSKQSLASSLSTRQLTRIARRNEKFGKSDKEHGTFEDVSRACLARFLPPLNKEELESAMKSNNIQPLKLSKFEEKNIEITNKILRIGETCASIWPDTEFKSKVPHLLFFNIQQHVRVLEDLLRDYLLGEHLLLVGNQGVGKNKLVDQLLFLLNRPREYIQLHRDTTVQNLTVQQKIIDGVVHFEDSPLVRACREGHVIVIDEADKSPTHVTCILKTLAESGEMILSDNRRIVPQSVIDKYYPHLSDEDKKRVIPLHPNFRMFVLANRPGFPFLGNDFYSVLGDLFSVHAIDNPSFESELELLKKYGPEIPLDYLERIANAFSELRTLSDDGSISYPYSTREAVNIVKHLQKYPGDTLAEAIDNVFDFDVYNSELRQTVRNTLRKYKLEPSEGILLRQRTSGDGTPLELKTVSATDMDKLLRHGNLDEFLKSNKNFNASDFTDPKFGKIDQTNAPHVGGNQWAGGSGGRGTAGLGGAGGPYRLDSGNPVFQVSDAVKQAVPPEVRKLAREMAQKAFEEKLKEIKMSKYEGNIYEQYLGPIRPQVQALRVILSSLQAKAKERKWVKHQTSGEFDDSKIIESVVGDKGIYKRRREEDPEPGDPQEKPKRLTLIVDVSGSMYRFNGYDRRLDRMLEVALLVMESFQGYEDIFRYEIIGHSGDDFKLPLVEMKEAPKDNKERLDVMRIMHLHSQFCSSGDNTLEATDDAVKSISKEVDDYDESYVIMLSDANLERYGIQPKELTKILNSQSDVKAFAIFVGSLGDQAQRLTEELPAGKSFVCLDTTKLPKILQRIFTQTILT